MKKPTGARRGAEKSGRAYSPDRGHFVYLDFTPQAGREQAGRRPALILSPQLYNIATGWALAVPITTRAKGGSFEVPIPPAARVNGVVLSDHLRSVDWLARRAEFHSVAPQDLVWEVLARIEAVLSLDLGR